MMGGRIVMVLFLAVYLQSSFGWNLKRDQTEQRKNVMRLFQLEKDHSNKLKRQEVNLGKRYVNAEFPAGVTPVLNKGREQVIEESSRFTSAGEPDYSEQVEVGLTGREEVLAEGDMHLTIEQWNEMQALKNGSLSLEERKGQANTRYRWRDNVVPYTIQDSAYSASEKAEIISALEDWSAFTCVQWTPRTSQNNYVSIQFGNGCSSYVGMIGNMQPVTLGQYCYQKDVALHEFGHALGLWHEQSRHDRDNYVTVHYDNMDMNMANNFEKYPAVELVYFGEGYDYSSIMHYGQGFFSSNGQPTITTVDPAYQDLIGNGKGLSFSDVKVVNEMYNCGANCPGTCPGNGFLDQHCVCQCPSQTSPFDFCGHIPYTPCDGSPYQGPPPTACPQCVDNHNVPTCTWYSNNGACDIGSSYFNDAMTNCYRTCSDCANPSAATTPGSNPTPAATTPAPAAPSTSTPAPASNNYDQFIGTYECHIYDNGGKNDWHYVTIARQAPSSQGDYVWSNRAGVSWTLFVDSSLGDNVLRVGTDCPYYGNGHTTLQMTTEGVLGPWGELYNKESSESSPTPPPTQPGSACGGTLVGSSGIITSPNYPNRYPNNANCEWTIEVPAGKVILFEQTPGTEFGIEPCGICQYDVLEIDYDSNTARDCGNSFAPVQTTSNIAHLTFSTDCSVTLAGFSITYTAVDAGSAVPNACTGFACSNGGCVSSSWVCDGDNDCGDYSDEQDCGSSSNTCAGYSCGNGGCVPTAWICDGDNDCGDMTDEQDCGAGSSNCAVGNFACSNGGCVPESWICDGDNDCGDMSDEQDCAGRASNCAEFSCGNGGCVYNSWICDGDNDCGDYSDEQGCK